MRHTRAHTANRRSHHALVASRISVCQDCGEKALRHRACLNCGKYKGVQVIDIEAKKARAERRTKAKKEVMGEKPAQEK